MKAPYRAVVGLSERLACGHHITLRVSIDSTKRRGAFSGRATVFVHAKRRCAECLAGAAPPLSTSTVEKLDATLRRVDQVLTLVEQLHRRTE